MCFEGGKQSGSDGREDMLPELFKKRMQQMLGEEYTPFLEGFGEQHCQALRLNALKKGLDGRSAAGRYGAGKDGDVYEKQNVGNVFAHLTKVPWAENGYYYQPEDQPGKHPFHEAGVYYIQEPSAMAPAELLDVKPGERVLDLCAAPGGKSTQIAAKLLGRGILVCNEIHPARAKILSENIERMGICNACVTNETPERLAEFFPGYFDKVLVDAPCSGEGMFRKNEAACDEWSPENVKLCAERQDGILDQAARMLRPGGKLVYSTCTFAPEEDEGTIVRFLSRHREFTVLPLEKERIGLAGCDGSAEYLEYGTSGEAVTGVEGHDFHLERTFRMWPQRVCGEGHFAALLQKDGGLAAEAWGERAAGSESSAEEPGSLMEGKRENPGRLIEERIRSPKRFREKQLRNPKRQTNGLQREPDKEIEAMIAFCDENIRFSNRTENIGNTGKTGENSLFSEIGRALGMGEEVRHVRFGDNVYLVPAEMPSLSGLKVLRPGLHLGELKKNRFEPSHALALALPPESAMHVWNLDSSDPLAAAWLMGQTFPAEGEKGWYLICVEGFSLGWGKLAGGIMKNHYPIGLRRRDMKEF